MSRYFWLYFCTLSILWASASSTIFPVITFSLFNFASVAASPTIWVISLNLVDNFVWSFASLDANSITFAIPDLSSGGSSSVWQNPSTTLANLFIFSNVKGASSSNSTFILNSFLKSVSTDIKVWYNASFPINITFKLSGIGSGFSETITIDECWSTGFSIPNSFVLNTFFNVS